MVKRLGLFGEPCVPLDSVGTQWTKLQVNRQYRGRIGVSFVSK